MQRDYRELFEQEGPDYRDQYGQHILYLAVMTDDVELVKDILDQGVDPNRSGTRAGRLPLHVAAYRSAFTSVNPAVSVQIVELLLQHGADINRLDEHNRTVLHNATATCGCGCGSIHPNHDFVEFIKSKINDQKIEH